MTQLKDFKGVALFALGGFVAIATMFSVQGIQAQQASPQGQVYSVCSESRLVNDGQLEERCGLLQNLYNYEFLCDGIEADSHCWTEKNDHLSN